MIDELRIAGLGVIEEATLQLSPGLTVISGETGAGKTMLVTALQLLLGARASAGLVRAGAEYAVAEARVTPVPAAAVEAGWVDDGEAELVVSREVLPDGGRSRARISGRLAPVSALADVLGRWVEVHAQGEHVRLARPEVQRTLLDRYAGTEHARLLDAYRDSYQRWQETRARLASVEENARRRAREVEQLTHEVAEIDRAELDEEADRRLEQELTRLAHAEELTLAAGAAAAALDEDGAGGPMGAAVGTLRRVADHDPALADLLERLEAIAVEAADLRLGLRDYAETLEADPARLEELRQRDRLLRDLIRKYGDDVAGVLAYGREARTRLEQLQSEEAESGELRARAGALASEVGRLAEDVREGRLTAARRLSEAVEGHLADLAMPHARFRVTLRPQPEPGPDGADRVVFELAANPGEPARPLAEAASGGERSRVALAVEVALADVDEARVLVFDEVDAGVGGATALAVGQKLARLAHPHTGNGEAGGQGRQVLCVTHLAQLAAFADVHHVVEKRVREGRTVTVTRRVGDDERAAELARMLSGSPDREAGLLHARELLAEAGRRGH